MKKKKRLLVFILCIFIIVLIYSLFHIYTYIMDENKNKKIEDEIASLITQEKNDNIDNNNEQENVYKINFEELKNKNNDTFGFIKIENTSIEYPVVKTTNNDYYLTHSFDKNYNSAGWIFADYRNKLDETDKNIILYGHNMKNNTMFGTLKNIFNQEWYSNKDNLKIIFITESENCLYEVFSIYKIQDEGYYTTTDFNENEFQIFIDIIKKRSIVDFNTELNINDEILTLSTCANNNKYRVVLHAKKLK